MLICRLSPRLFLAFPDDDRADTRQYVFCRELADVPTETAHGVVRQILDRTYRSGQIQKVP